MIAILRGGCPVHTAISDTYAYDGNSLRASQTIFGTTTYVTWDMTKGLPLLLNDGTNNYIYGPGGPPVEQINTTTGTTLYLHHDQAGSTRLLTGSTGKTEATFTYDAYGNQTGHTGTATTPLGYDGQYTSADTGLIYLRNRVYDPSTAQFLTRDPLAMQTGEPYSYVRNNPLNGDDRSGLSGEELELRAFGRVAVRRHQQSKGSKNLAKESLKVPKSRGMVWNTRGTGRLARVDATKLREAHLTREKR